MSDNSFKIKNSVVLGKSNTDPVSPESGELYFNDSTNKFRKYDGFSWEDIGAGGGNDELLPNPSAEAGITNWTEGSYSASARPSGTFTPSSGAGLFAISTTTSNPLNGNTSFLLTKAASNQQGRAIISEFDLQVGNRAKCLDINVQYIVNSGTFTAGTSSTDSSLIFYTEFYDGSAWTMAEPSSFRLLSNSTTISDVFSGTVQTPYNATKMRLIAYVAETATNAWEIKCEMSVKPSKYVYGTPVTDWQSYTPATQGLGTISNVDLEWRRNGPDLEIRGRLQLGTLTNVQAQLGFPPGLTAKALSISPQQVGNFWRYQATLANNFGGPLLVSGGGNFIGFGTSNAFSTSGGNQDMFAMLNATSIFGNNNVIGIQASVPIQGWSSSVQMSDSASTRIVAAKASGNPASATSGNPIIVPSVAFDTHGAYNPVTGRYTVIVPGIYRISFVGIVNPLAAHTITVYKNGASDTLLGAISANTNAVTGSVSVTAVAGDLLDVRPNATVDYSGGTSLMFERLSGPSAIAASELVAFRANSSSGAALGTIETLYVYPTVTFDTHGAYNSSTGVFTVPTTGKYQINAAISSATGTYAAGNLLKVAIYKNGVVYSEVYSRITSTLSTTYSVAISDVVDCVAGDTIDIRPVKSGTAVNSNAVAAANYFTAQRIGF